MKIAPTGGGMDDGLVGPSSDRAITAQSSEIKSQDSRVVDSMSTGWTDEKHSLYLNSIETSFVNQLYSSEHLSKDFLGWPSRTGKHTSSYGSSAKSLFSGQFKVQRLGCWENLKFERAKRRVDIENQSRLLSENPWIQRFRSSSIGKELHITSSNNEKELNIAPSDKVDDNKLDVQPIHLSSLRQRREATSLKQLPTCYSHHQDSVNSNAEVSDQNFVDKEFEGEEQSSIACYKKRSRSVIPDSPIKDQVVPSGKSLLERSSDECHVRLEEKDAECSSRKAQTVTCFLYLDPEQSSFKDQELNSEGPKEHNQ